MRACAQALLDVQGRTALEILGSPDVLKACSRMSLFAALASADLVFGQVLDKYDDGEPCPRTLDILAEA